jgi:hypothetical protein
MLRSAFETQTVLKIKQLNTERLPPNRRCIDTPRVGPMTPQGQQCSTVALQLTTQAFS